MWLPDSVNTRATPRRSRGDNDVGSSQGFGHVPFTPPLAAAAGEDFAQTYGDCVNRYGLGYPHKRRGQADYLPQKAASPHRSVYIVFRFWH